MILAVQAKWHVRKVLLKKKKTEIGNKYYCWIKTFAQIAELCESVTWALPLLSCLSCSDISLAKNSQELQLHGVHIFLFQGDNQPLPLLLLHLWVPKKHPMPETQPTSLPKTDKGAVDSRAGLDISIFPQDEGVTSSAGYGYFMSWAPKLRHVSYLW